MTGAKGVFVTAALGAVAAGSTIAAMEYGKIAEIIYDITGQQTPLERTIGNALEEELGAQVFVECANIPQSLQEANPDIDIVAYVEYDWPDWTMHMRPQNCEVIGQISERTKLYEDDDIDTAAKNLLYLAHEDSHMRFDTEDEAAAQCYGVQTAPAVAARLGASADVAHQLGRYIAGNVNSWYAADNGYRFTADCVDGGSLDLARGEPSEYFPVFEPVS